jgi:diguanylate cyclase
MATPDNPSEIARETIKTLARQKLAPTPDNYARVFQEISGQISGDASGATEPPTKSKSTLAWSSLIRDLLRQIETPHKGITVSRKKEGLETVLAKFANNPDTLHEKLQGLMRSWAGPTSTAPANSAPVTTAAETASPAAGAIAAAPSVAKPIAKPTPGDGTILELITQLRELLAQSLESTLSAHPELKKEIQVLAQQVRTAPDPEQVIHMSKQLRQFWIRLDMHGNDKIQVQEGLLRLLRLLVGNVSEFVPDEKWIQGQIVTVKDIIEKPLDKRNIADAERSLRDATIKQGMLNKVLADAKNTLKTLMTTFIDRLGEMTESTGEYHNKIEAYSQKIGKTDNLAELSHLLQDIMQDTRVIQARALHSHEELVSVRKHVVESEERIRQLEHELDEASQLVREDQLTHALNRRGMEETFTREAARADRNNAPISVSLLDIDNFKQLNDSRGHQAGDHALVHLTNVIKSTLRPSDAVARYGGEEFLIILPDTDQDQAMELISRLQRELTKKFFLHNNERLLITFSAGVTLRDPGEDLYDVIGRADRAMYQAKQTGKNRVVKSVDHPIAAAEFPAKPD